MDHFARVLKSVFALLCLLMLAGTGFAASAQKAQVDTSAWLPYEMPDIKKAQGHGPRHVVPAGRPGGQARHF